ncbi:MAG: hypothetical protein JW967_04725 [Dehalococcoidales bacterium]|nr:hypothetical protein [Dehalococcoidales bacterium]
MADCFVAIKTRGEGVDIIFVDKNYVCHFEGVAVCFGSYAVFKHEWGDDMDACVNQISQTGE